MLRAFASGCTAMTGVEAVSNAVPVFREPRLSDAKRTLLAIVAILAVLLVGLGVLSPAYHIGATQPGKTGYQSVLSQLTGAVIGRGVIDYVTIASVVAVPCCRPTPASRGSRGSAGCWRSTAFSPRGSRTKARGWSTPKGFVLLASVAAVLLAVFEGITDRLISLFAVGAFLAFNVAAGDGGALGGATAAAATLLPRAQRGGAAATGATLAVIVISSYGRRLDHASAAGRAVAALQPRARAPRRARPRGAGRRSAGRLAPGTAGGGYR